MTRHISLKTLLIGVVIFFWYLPASASVIGFQIQSATSSLSGTFVITDGVSSTFAREFTISGTAFGNSVVGNSPLGSIIVQVGAGGAIAGLEGEQFISTVVGDPPSLIIGMDFADDTLPGGPINDFNCRSTDPSVPVCDQQVQVSTTARYTFSSVPEPTTLALLGLGLAGIGYGRRRSKKLR